MPDETDTPTKHEIIAVEQDGYQALGYYIDGMTLRELTLSPGEAQAIEIALEDGSTHVVVERG